MSYISDNEESKHSESKEEQGFQPWRASSAGLKSWLVAAVVAELSSELELKSLQRRDSAGVVTQLWESVVIVRYSIEIEVYNKPDYQSNTRLKSLNAWQ
jgi:hypothetical protein